MVLEKFSTKNSKFYRDCISLTFLPQSNFAVFDDWYFLQYCLQRTKIVQIAQLNQLFQLLHLVHIYGYGFYELSRMIMRKNVNNDVRKDSPCPQRFAYMSLYVLLGVLIWSVVPVNHRRGDWTWKSAKLNWKKKKLLMMEGGAWHCTIFCVVFSLHTNRRNK